MKKQTLRYPTSEEIEEHNHHLLKINQKWDELRRFAKEDLKNPPDEDFNLPSINQKWLSYRSDWVKAKIDLSIMKDKIEKELILEYRFNHDLSLEKDELKLFIRSDSRFVKLYDKCERISGILQFIEGVLTSIQQKYHLIREYNIRLRYLKGSLD